MAITTDMAREGFLRELEYKMKEMDRWGVSAYEKGKFVDQWRREFEHRWGDPLELERKWGYVKQSPPATAVQMQAMARAEKLKKEQAARALIDSPEYACSLVVAKDLWLTKFGDGWVAQSDVEDALGMQWRKLCTRLIAARCMEQETATDFVRLIP